MISFDLKLVFLFKKQLLTLRANSTAQVSEHVARVQPDLNEPEKWDPETPERLTWLLDVVGSLRKLVKDCVI